MEKQALRTSEQLKSLVREGISSARDKDYEEAYSTLGEALDGYRAKGEKIPAVALSYYALALGLHLKKFKQAIELCQSALNAEPSRVDHYVNLALLYQAARFRRKAVEMVARGLELDGGNVRLLQLKATLGWRRPPVVSSLSRDHWLNIFLGKLRHSLSPPKVELAHRQGKGKNRKF